MNLCGCIYDIVRPEKKRSCITYLMKREPQKRFNKQTGVLVAIGQEKPGLFVAQQRQTGGWFCGGDHLPTYLPNLPIRYIFKGNS